MSNGAKSKKFKEYVKAYCEKKEEEKLLKKEISNLSSEIKSYLNENDAESGGTDEWSVELQHKLSESLDEEKLISSIQQYWLNNNIESPCPYIQYVPVINMEELEKRIYQHEVPDAILDAVDKCRIQKESVALIYKKVKKES